jgi:hypothetical protein
VGLRAFHGNTSLQRWGNANIVPRVPSGVVKKMSKTARVRAAPMLVRARSPKSPDQRRRTGVSALHWFWISYKLALVPIWIGWGYCAGGVQAGYLFGG